MQTDPTTPEPIITLRPRRPRPKVVSLTDRAAERVREIMDALAISAGAAVSWLVDATVLGDLNGDGLVNGADLGGLLGAWGTPGPGDLDGNGIVNGADLGIMLGEWR